MYSIFLILKFKFHFSYAIPYDLFFELISYPYRRHTVVVYALHSPPAEYTHAVLHAKVGYKNTYLNT